MFWRNKLFPSQYFKGLISASPCPTHHICVTASDIIENKALNMYKGKIFHESPFLYLTDTYIMFN